MRNVDTKLVAPLMRIITFVGFALIGGATSMHFACTNLMDRSLNSSYVATYLHCVLFMVAIFGMLKA